MEKIKFKPLKQAAKHVLKKHYLLFVVLCLFAAFLGTEFSGSLQIFVIESGLKAAEEAKTTSVAGISSIYAAIFEDTMSSYEEEVKEDETQEEEKTSAISILQIGHQRGVLAGLVNRLSSGTIYVMIYSAIKNIVKSSSAAGAIFIILSLLLYGIFWAFIVHIFKVIYTRFFIEARIYARVPKSRLKFLIRRRSYLRSVGTMLLRALYLFLWSLTIVGGIIKHYSYYMVPYILAENPSLKANDVITLSRRMMKGHKWQCFLLDLTFIGWDLLDVATLGLLGIFFLNPYKTASFSEYYVELRKQYKASGEDKEASLNDVYLYEFAPDDLLQSTYADVVAAEADFDPEFTSTNKVHNFFAKWFGIVLSYNSDEERAYREYSIRKHKIKDCGDILKHELYPLRLSNIPIKEKEEDAANLGSGRSYSVTSLIMIFFATCIIGWLWEVSLHLIQDGEFVNRGTLFGPWLPIYGSGALMILILLRRFRDKPWLEFILAVVLCGLVEYFSSYYLQVSHGGMKWWDYTGYFLNLNGRICAEGLLTFGLGGMAAVYLLAPALDNLFRKIKTQVAVVICVVLVALFAADSVYSHYHPNEGKGITDYAGIPEIPTDIGNVA